MKIAIVGCGWLGLPLAKELLKDGHTIFGSTTSEGKIKELAQAGILPFIYNEEQNKLEKSLTDSDCLIINFPPSKSKNYPDQIEKLLEHFPKNCKVIYTSSTSIYTNVNEEINESSELNKSSLMYSAEQKILCSQKKSTILRLAGLIGPNRHPINYMSGKTISDGNLHVNLIHLKDVIASIKYLIDKDVWGEIYNICKNEHPTKSSYYSYSAEKRKLPLPIFEHSLITGKIVSSSKIEQELNFQFKHSIYMHENE